MQKPRLFTVQQHWLSYYFWEVFLNFEYHVVIIANLKMQKKISPIVPSPKNIFEFFPSSPIFYIVFYLFLCVLHDWADTAHPISWPYFLANIITFFILHIFFTNMLFSGLYWLIKFLWRVSQMLRLSMKGGGIKGAWTPSPRQMLLFQIEECDK